jgi:hypothetical protein
LASLPPLRSGRSAWWGGKDPRDYLMVPYRRPELLLVIGTEVYNGPFGEALL